MLRYAIVLSTEAKQNISVNRAALVEVLDQVDHLSAVFQSLSIRAAHLAVAHLSMESAITELNHAINAVLSDIRKTTD